jgi:hypothetical protein
MVHPSWGVAQSLDWLKMNNESEQCDAMYLRLPGIETDVFDGTT